MTRLNCQGFFRWLGTMKGGYRSSKVATTEANVALEKDTHSRVYLIDDHPLVVQGITALLNREKDLRVVGSTNEWTVALGEIPVLEPNIVLLDMTLPGANGLEVLKSLLSHFPRLSVLILSMHDEGLYARRSMRAGARGFIMKWSAVDELIVAIRKVLRGDVYLSPRMAKLALMDFAGRRREGTGSPLDELSDRELEVFQMIGDGLSIRQIAERLHLSAKTVETHKGHIKVKLRFKTSLQLAQHAIQAKEGRQAMISS